MHKYEIIIYWSHEDGVFVGEPPELPGCMVHGETQESVLKEVGKAVELRLDTAREFDGLIPESKGERMMLA